MSQEQLEFIKACQNAQDEAYSIGDLDLALSWSSHILEALRQVNQASPGQSASGQTIGQKH